jgi:hypothetical protein
MYLQPLIHTDLPPMYPLPTATCQCTTYPAKQQRRLMSDYPDSSTKYQPSIEHPQLVILSATPTNVPSASAIYPQLFNISAVPPPTYYLPTYSPIYPEHSDISRLTNQPTNYHLPNVPLTFRHTTNLPFTNVLLTNLLTQYIRSSLIFRRSTTNVPLTNLPFYQFTTRQLRSFV